MENLNNLVQLARQHSPFYTDHLKSIEHVKDLEDLPIIDYNKFWEAAHQDRRNVMTETQVDGFVIRSGGTTSKPKKISWSQAEIQRASQLMGLGLIEAGLQPGDRIANLFHAGDLYGSFLIFALSILALPIPAVHIPIGTTPSPDLILSHLQDGNASVLIGCPTVLVSIAQHCLAQNLPLPAIHAVMYSGESLFPTQKSLLERAFPRATIRTFVYASTDGGVIASSAGTISGDDENDHRLLRVFGSVAMVEIVSDEDEEQQQQRVITENFVPGKILVTNLNRRLSPVIRYPVGDRGEWVNRASGVFRLLGRGGEAIRIGPVSIEVGDLRRVVGRVLPGFVALQAVLRQDGEGLDELECVVAVERPVEDVEGIAREITELMYAERTLFRDVVDRGMLAPMKVRFVGMEDMITGSGKLRQVVDLRS